MAIHLGRMLPCASCDTPERQRENTLEAPNKLGPPAALLGLAPGGVYLRQCCYQHRGALLPHPFTLTHINTGGLLSVALSLRSPSPAVSRHRVFVEPGLSSFITKATKAAIRPSDPVLT